MSVVTMCWNLFQSSGERSGQLFVGSVGSLRGAGVISLLSLVVLPNHSTHFIYVVKSQWETVVHKPNFYLSRRVRQFVRRGYY